jgi:hypothetical protein
VQGTSTSGTGVSGNSQRGIGVTGNSPNGAGVSGSSNQNIGVYGTSNNPNLGSIWGDSQINAGAGVVGNSTNGYAIWGQSSTDASKLEGGSPYANVGVYGLAYVMAVSGYAVRTDAAGPVSWDEAIDLDPGSSDPAQLRAAGDERSELRQGGS